MTASSFLAGWALRPFGDSRDLTAGHDAHTYDECASLKAFSMRVSLNDYDAH